MAKKPLNQLSIQARTAGHIIQLAVEELLPEHHAIGACDGEGGIFNVVFSGFIDQINLNSIQNNVDNIIKSQLPIVRHHYSAEEFKQSGIIVYYQLPKLKKISTITIGEYRPVTDGGTTLSSTSESWPITLTEFIYDKDSTSIHYQLTEPTPEKVTPKTITQPSTLTLVDYQTKVTNLKDLFKEDTINSASQTKYLGKNGLINQLAK